MRRLRARWSTSVPNVASAIGTPFSGWSGSCANLGEACSFDAQLVLSRFVGEPDRSYLGRHPLEGLD